jgi:hypothetical protein
VGRLNAKEHEQIEKVIKEMKEQLQNKEQAENDLDMAFWKAAEYLTLLEMENFLFMRVKALRKFIQDNKNENEIDYILNIKLAISLAFKKVDDEELIQALESSLKDLKSVRRYGKILEDFINDIEKQKKVG